MGPVRRKDEELRAQIQEFKKKIREGMSLDEIIAVLGRPSSIIQGGSPLGRFGDVSGAPGALSSLSRNQYYVWRRPEGEWRLVFAGDRLPKYLSDSLAADSRADSHQIKR